MPGGRQGEEGVEQGPDRLTVEVLILSVPAFQTSLLSS